MVYFDLLDFGMCWAKKRFEQDVLSRIRSGIAISIKSTEHRTQGKSCRSYPHRHRFQHI